MSGPDAGMKEVWVRASHDPHDGRRRDFWKHEHELMSPAAARKAQQEQREQEVGWDFIDYLQGAVPADASKCYLVYRFYENSAETHAFHLTYEEAKKHFDEEASQVSFYHDEVRLTEETTEGHMLCTSCSREDGGASYTAVDKTHAAILRVIDLDEWTC